jgi:hypothetical protein
MQMIETRDVAEWSGGGGGGDVGGGGGVGGGDEVPLTYSANRSDALCKHPGSSPSNP